MIPKLNTEAEPPFAGDHHLRSCMSGKFCFSYVRLERFHPRPPWCLPIYARNSTLSKSEIEKYLRDYLGVELVLWLGQGVIGDVDTDGHIDNLLAFVRPGEVSKGWMGLDIGGMK